MIKNKNTISIHSDYIKDSRVDVLSKALSYLGVDSGDVVEVGCSFARFGIRDDNTASELLKFIQDLDGSSNYIDISLSRDITL